MYESLDSKSNYSVHPNSVDNDILHRIRNYVMDNKKNNKIEKNKINKNLKEAFLYDDETNKSQDNLPHPKRNNNVKINFIDPQIINGNKKTNNKKQNNNNNEVKNKNNLILDIKKEDTNEFSPLNKTNNKPNEKKIKIEKIKIIKSNNTSDSNKEEKNKDKDKDNEQNSKNDIKVDEIQIEKDKDDKVDKDKDNSEKIKLKENKDENINNESEKKERGSFIEKPIESDVSAEKDLSKNIIWEYALSPKNLEKENMSENKKNIIMDSNEDLIINDEDLIIQNEEKIEEPKEEEKMSEKYEEEKISEKNEEEKLKEENNKENEEKKQEQKKEEKSDKKPKEENKEKINEEKENNKKEEKKIENNEKEENEDNFELEDILLSDENSKSLKNSKRNEEKIMNIKENEIKKENNDGENKAENKNKGVTLVLNRYEFKIEDENNIIIPKKNDTKKQLSNKTPDDLTEEIIKEIIETEIIKKNESLLPKKAFKNENFSLNISNNLLNNSGSVSFKENMLKDGSFPTQNSFQSRDNNFPNFYLNESIMSSISASSIFNRTIKDKKKEKSIRLYLKKIAPILIKLIQEEIYAKYSRIYDNISNPLINNSKEIMVALELQNGEMIRDNYKKNFNKEEIKDIIDKEKILKKIEPINKEIRNNDNIFDDNYYDKMLNECIIDTAIEIIKNERKYGEDGDPLPWGGRTREFLFRYEKNKPKKLVEHVTEKLVEIINTKIGLINTNYEYLTQEQLNIEKEKRLIRTLKDELKENEEHWNNLEIEETQLKIEITEIINEQLYNEVMEILEHIALSRKKPELYQNKSIFVCEEIPKLSFQQNTTDNKGFGFNGEENDLINM